MPRFASRRFSNTWLSLARAYVEWTGAERITRADAGLFPGLRFPGTVAGFMEPSVNLNRFSSKTRDMEDVCFDVLKEFDRTQQFGLLLKAIREESPDLKKFCTRHLTPRPESSAGNEGDALQYLCNRLAQEMDFWGASARNRRRHRFTSCRGPKARCTRVSSAAFKTGPCRSYSRCEARIPTA